MKKPWKILILIFAIIIVLFLLVSVVKNNRPNTPGNSQSNFNIAYGSDPDQKYDFFKPEGNKNSDTLIILIHGGAWIAGDKAGFTSMGQFFSNKGYSVINMNYRKTEGKNPNWDYREPLWDISTVLSIVQANPEKFNLNPGYKIVLIGHSAGGHLSNLYGVRETYYSGNKNVDYVVSLAGPTDFVSLQSEGWVSPLLDKYLNGVSKEEASPARHVSYGDNTKFLLVLGLRDNLVPLQQVEIFEDKLQEGNVYVDTLVLSERDHNTIVSMIPQNDAVAQKILDFIQ